MTADYIREVPKGTRIASPVYHSIRDLLLQTPSSGCSDRQIAAAHCVSRSVVARIRRILDAETGTRDLVDRHVARLGAVGKWGADPDDR